MPHRQIPQPRVDRSDPWFWSQRLAFLFPITAPASLALGALVSHHFPSAEPTLAVLIAVALGAQLVASVLLAFVPARPRGPVTAVDQQAHRFRRRTLPLLCILAVALGSSVMASALPRPWSMILRVLGQVACAAVMVAGLWVFGGERWLRARPSKASLKAAFRWASALRYGSVDVARVESIPHGSTFSWAGIALEDPARAARATRATLRTNLAASAPLRAAMNLSTRTIAPATLAFGALAVGWGAVDHLRRGQLAEGMNTLAALLLILGALVACVAVLRFDRRRAERIETALQRVAIARGAMLDRNGAARVLDWLDDHWPEHLASTTSHGLGFGRDWTVALQDRLGPALLRVRAMGSGEDMAALRCIELLVPGPRAASAPALGAGWSTLAIPGGVHLVRSDLDLRWLTPEAIDWLLAHARSV